MKTANISYTKNHLSELLDHVRAGESILIVDRKCPVARLEPAGDVVSQGKGPGWMEELVRCGLVRPASSDVDGGAILRRPLVDLTGKVDVVRMLREDREDRV